MDDSFDSTNPGATVPGAAGAGGDGGGSSFPAASPAAAANGNGGTETFAPAQPTYLNAPQSWRREVADKHWNRLEHDLRQYIHQREHEAQRQIAQSGERGNKFKPFEELLNKYGQVLPQGVAPHDALGYLLEGQRKFAENPAQAIAYLMQSSGIDPRTLLQPEVRQHYDALAQQYEYAQRRIAAAEAAIGVREEARAQQMRAEFVKERKAEEARRAEDMERKVVDARRAARINVRSSGFAHPNPRTMDDTISQVADRIYGVGTR